ncbi:MAG TPA: prolyl oligopeptidase family serine peptidase [Candidatus Dormibacteraeota bacterium]|nr:prolyl oligopeptidase family serine peptidase [Candidatus Dormibacteraeota bacterium]
MTLVLLVACTSSATTKTSSSTPAGPNILTGSLGAASYTIEVPQPWNGTLFLYSHGYVAPGGTNPSSASPDPVTGQWLVKGGYAVAASSYSSTGWAIEDALRDQIALLDYFQKKVGKPKRVIAIGASLGGIITAGLVQNYPDRFAGAIPLCGVLAGGVATWNTGLDAAYAFKTLLAPQSQLQLVHITDPAANAKLAADLVAGATQTQTGKARMALVSALADLPGWFVPTQPEPAATDFSAQAAAQLQWESRVDFPFAFRYRAELEKRAGGNVSWNVGVDYRHQLDISPDRDEVIALYRAAGLNLNADLAILNAGATIKPDKQAAGYLDRFISFNGDIRVPVLALHTTADGLVIPQEETAYADVVRAAGKQDLLRQVFVHRAGHCAFTSAEVISVIKEMLHRLITGVWEDPALLPGAMNKEALDLGPQYNSIGGIFAAQPAFADFSPGPYPRPFPMGVTLPA